MTGGFRHHLVVYRDDLESAQAAIRTLKAEVEAQRKQAEAAVASKLAAEAARDEMKLALSHAGGQVSGGKSRMPIWGIVVGLLGLSVAGYAWYGGQRNASETEARHHAAAATLEGRIAKLRGEIGSLRKRQATHKVARSLSRETIRAMVRMHMKSVQACYESALATQPGLAGRLVTEWVIGPMGTVQSARQISSTLKSASVEACVLGLIRTWRFPPTGEEKSVRYPFVFVHSSGGGNVVKKLPK